MLCFASAAVTPLLLYAIYYLNITPLRRAAMRKILPKQYYMSSRRRCAAPMPICADCHARAKTIPRATRRYDMLFKNMRAFTRYRRHYACAQHTPQ